jgi:ribonucleoside-diphosphate reductase alpha subunit
MMSNGGSKKAYSDENAEMKVIKRNGKMENISFDKILRRLKKIGKEKNIKINFASLAIRIIDQLYTKIPTTKIDELTAEQCASMSSISPEYEVLALHIIVSNHHKNTQASFSATMNDLYNFRDINGKHTPLVADDFIEVVRENAELFDSMCDFSRDYLLSYFGFKTLEKSYLMHINKRIVERPQHMWLRVAVGIHGRDIENVRKTYELMSQKKFTHATPTLFNSGTPHPQLSSCFLLAMDDDSIEGIFKTISECALISKWSGGIGVSCSKIRAKGSIIRGTNGRSNGIVPMLRVFNSTCLYVDQCLLPDTPIYTTDGPIQIQDVRAGKTAIYNLTGQTEVVKNVLEHPYDGEICIIKSPYFNDLYVTPQHPIATISVAAVNAPPEEDYEVSWTDAAELRPGHDMIVFSIPQIPEPETPPTQTLEDCYMYGLMLHSAGPFGKSNNCTLSIYKKFQDVTSFVETYLENHCCTYTTAEKKNAIKDWNMVVYEWKRTINLPFRHTDFGDTTRIHPEWLNLPEQHIKQILRGLIDAYSPIIFGNHVYYENPSAELIEGMRFLWLRLGVLVKIGSQNLEDDIVLHFIKIPYNIETREILNIDENIISLNVLYNGTAAEEYRRYKNYLLAPVTANELAEYSGVLYDLQMTDEHNYMVHHGVVHNGGGKRNGSFAIYLEPWHADVEDFLQMRKNHGDENLKARDLFYALWIPDLFMKRVKENGTWTLMCPNECPGLCDVYGEEFNKLYTKYEEEHRGRRTMKARDLWFQILDAQMETGTPYLLYKDAVNHKSNQKNIGTIKSSNLCSEITEYTDENETAVCNLASISLPAFVKRTDANSPLYYDYDELHEVAKTVAFNLNRVIDVNYYPNEKTRRSNMRHRPIGIGVQGLADVFMIMRIPFESEEAQKINKNIFETIYHAALESSCEIARSVGPYETFEGSPASQGLLQFDLWGYEQPNDRYDWPALKENIKKHGLRNSLLVAPMPTASTSQILGNNECFEPITSNIYSRRTLAGDFIVVNKYMMTDLINMGLWSKELKDKIIANQGSIFQIEEIPSEIKNIYKTVWEMSQKTLIDLAVDRGKYVCQSMSLNLWVEDPTYNILTSMHYYAHEKGLKTGIYYLRRRARHQAQQFTIKPEKKEVECEMCSG